MPSAMSLGHDNTRQRTYRIALPSELHTARVICVEMLAVPAPGRFRDTQKADADSMA